MTNMTKNIAWTNDKLAYDSKIMQCTLDKAGTFYISHTKGYASTRAFFSERGRTAHLNLSGKYITTGSWEECDGMRWISMADGGTRKILMGFQAMRSKIYALVQSWPLKDPGAKKFHDDNDTYRIDLNEYPCVIASFDEILTNSAGCMAKMNMNEVLKNSTCFVSKWLKNVDLYHEYAKCAVGRDMMMKVCFVFDACMLRQRKEIAKNFKGDKEGEIVAIEAMMHMLEPTRLALEDFAEDYDLPLSQRIYQFPMPVLATGTVDEDACEALLTQFVDCVKYSQF